MNQTQQWAETYSPDYRAGYEAALEAARQAVEAVPQAIVTGRFSLRSTVVYRDDAMAAIDVLVAP